MNKDLMLAVLAMNAYDETINAIGTAQFRPTDLPIGNYENYGDSPGLHPITETR